MRILVSSLAALFLASQTAHAQCSTLAVTGSGKPGTALKLELSGATPSSLVFLGISQDPGKTVFNFGPLGALTWDLASPVISPLIGRTDRGGKLAVSITVPLGTPAFDLKGQAATGGLTVDRTTTPPSVKFKFCTSNVVDLKGGGA